MDKYEVLYVLPSTLEDGQKIHEELKGILTRDGAKLIQENIMKDFEFAYPVKKHKKGTYHILILETSIENINELKRISNTRKNEILRLFIINCNKEKNYQEFTTLNNLKIEDEYFARPIRKFFSKPNLSNNPKDNPKESKKEVDESKVKLKNKEDKKAHKKVENVK